MRLRSSSLLFLILTCTQIPAASAASDLFKDMQLRTETHQLTSAEFTEQKTSLVKIVNEQDPAKAMAALAGKMQKYKSIERSCHALVHAIGHSAYEKYKNFSKAMEYQDDLCGSGYLHGIIETHFLSVKDVRAEMQTVCKGSSGKCYHGVGHGVMFVTDNDVPASLALCDTYKDSSKRIQCAEGVFMENFNTDQKLHRSKYLKENDPLYPCPLQTPLYKHACYFYAPRLTLQLNVNSYDVAFGICATAEKDYRATCYKGVGSAAMKQRISQPSLVESICLSAPAAGASPCLQGMASYYTVNFASTKKGTEMCMALRKESRKACLSGVR